MSSDVAQTNKPNRVLAFKFVPFVRYFNVSKCVATIACFLCDPFTIRTERVSCRAMTPEVDRAPFFLKLPA